METPRRQRAATADGETPPPGSAGGRYTPQARMRLDGWRGHWPARAQTRGQRAGGHLQPGGPRCPLPARPRTAPREGEARGGSAGGSESCPAAAPLSPSPRKAWSPLTPSRPGGATSRGRSREPNTRPRRHVHSGFAQEAPAGSASRARQSRVRKREFVQQKIAERSTYATRMNLKNVTWSKRSLTRNDAQ